MRKVMALFMVICMAVLLCSCSKFSIGRKAAAAGTDAGEETGKETDAVGNSDADEGNAVGESNEADAGNNVSEETKAAAEKWLGGTKYVCVSERGLASSDPFENRFYINLCEDGTASYYQPLYSSYRPFSTWRTEDGRLVLDDGCMDIVNYFDIVDGNLVYRAEESHGFMFYHFEDGEVFMKDVASVALGTVHDEIMEPFETELTGIYGSNFLIPIDGKIYRYIQSSDASEEYEKGEQIYSFEINDSVIKEKYKVYRIEGAEDDTTLYVECTAENVEPGHYDFILRYRGSRAAKDGDLERVKADGFIVMEGLHVTSGAELWTGFYKKVEQGTPCSVRIANYYVYDEPQYPTEESTIRKNDYPALYLKELIYDGKQFITRPLHLSGNDYISYCIEGDESPEQTWKYLMYYSLEAPRTTSKWTTCERYVLVNDDTLTWDKIEWGMFSSGFGDYIAHDSIYAEYEWK